MEDNFKIAKQKLAFGLKSLTHEDTDISPYLQYLALLNQWNATYNLTHIRDITEQVVLHVLDSLSISPYLSQTHYLDVGTGAGLPGIILAIFYPEKSFVLLDSNSKKTAFLLQVKQSLRLKNIDIMNCRAENYHPDFYFDGVMSRAVGNLGLLWLLGEPFLKEKGQILAMKANLESSELDTLPNGTDRQIVPLSVPFLQGTRHLAILKRSCYNSSKSSPA